MTDDDEYEGEWCSGPWTWKKIKGNCFNAFIMALFFAVCWWVMSTNDHSSWDWRWQGDELYDDLIPSSTIMTNEEDPLHGFPVWTPWLVLLAGSAICGVGMLCFKIAEDRMLAEHVKRGSPEGDEYRIYAQASWAVIALHVACVGIWTVGLYMIFRGYGW